MRLNEPIVDNDPPASFTISDIVWYNVLVLVLWHIGFMYTLICIIPSTSLSELLVLWILLWAYSGLGITAGAHRLWSHRSYKAKLPLRIFLMIANSMAFQGDIYEWSRDHRVHHKGSETNADPHNAKRGFFFAHMGWIMVKKQQQVKIEGQKINCDEILNDKVVRFQLDHYKFLVLLFCYGLPTFIGYYFFNNIWNGFWVGGIFRHVWVLHMTWMVNSVAHFWGEQPYDPKINPKENLIVAIGAIGEGWHNYHHRFPADYATGEWGILSGQWNPTKGFIDLCSFLGLAYDLRRSRTAAHTREKVAAMKKFEKEKLQEKENKLQQNTSTPLRQRVLEKVFFGRENEEIF